ncbi:hypothetical protein ACF0H5_020820 [Mactra antiquata]
MSQSGEATLYMRVTSLEIYTVWQKNFKATVISLEINVVKLKGNKSLSIILNYLKSQSGETTLQITIISNEIYGTTDLCLRSSVNDDVNMSMVGSSPSKSVIDKKYCKF